MRNIQRQVFDIDHAIDGYSSDPTQRDQLARTLRRGGAREGTTHVRGQCGFLGVLCNENLDPYGELKPDCGATCRGKNDTRAGEYTRA